MQRTRGPPPCPHPGPAPSTPQCPTCAKCFLSRTELQLHEAFKHRGEKLFVCEECGHRASSRNGLQMHIKAKHRCGLARHSPGPAAGGWPVSGPGRRSLPGPAWDRASSSLGPRPVASVAVAREGGGHLPGRRAAGEDWRLRSLQGSLRPATSGMELVPLSWHCPCPPATQPLLAWAQLPHQPCVLLPRWFPRLWGQASSRCRRAKGTASLGDGFCLCPLPGQERAAICL